VESPHESRWIEATGRVDYDQTFAPVATWESIRLLLGMVTQNKWKTKQLDYVLAFPQAPVDRECFMKMPLGITVDEPGEWALRVKNIYGQKQGRVWNLYLIDKLVNEIGFTQSGTTNVYSIAETSSTRILTIRFSRDPTRTN
jgi:hypothetical protein